MRTETAIDTLERVKRFSQEWILPGHVNGANTHNVSATISVKEEEWEVVGEWMWNQQEFYNGLSVLPAFDHTYQQAPFENITEEEYNTRINTLKAIDLTKVMEIDDNVEFSQVTACSGPNGCEINI
jgi:ribonucleoside-diphosphate reductase alpha chain